MKFMRITPIFQIGFELVKMADASDQHKRPEYLFKHDKRSRKRMFVTINLNLLCLYPIKFLKYSGKIDLLIEYSASSPSRKKCINLVTIFPNTLSNCACVSLDKKNVYNLVASLSQKILLWFCTRGSVCLHLMFFSDFVSLAGNLIMTKQACFQFLNRKCYFLAKCSTVRSFSGKVLLYSDLKNVRPT